MSYFTAVVAKGADGWSAFQIPLTEAADVEDVADRMRDADPGAAVTLLFVESDDSYLGILRLDQGQDLRVFGSDAAFADESRLGSLLLADVAEPPIELEEPVELEVSEPSEPTEEGEEEPAPLIPDVEPVGDVDLLADLGVPAEKLMELCAREGMLPSDITAEVCQAVGCGDEVEELREA